MHDIKLSRKRQLSPGIPNSPNWNRVRVSKDSLPPPQLDNMLEWCDNHCQGRYSYGSVMDHRTMRRDYSFWFRNRQDYTAFALIWGFT
jgi:hypothetical protein